MKPTEDLVVLSGSLLDDHYPDRESGVYREVSLEAGRVEDVLSRIVNKSQVCIYVVVCSVAKDVLRQLIPKSPWS